MSDRFVWKGDRVLKSLKDVGLEALWLLGQAVLAEAMEDVPVDTGTLLRSGAATVGSLPDPDGAYSEAQSGKVANSSEKTGNEGDTVFVSYSTPYVIKLHETPGWHGRRKPWAKWKWLERAIPRATKKFPAIARRAFGKLRKV